MGKPMDIVYIPDENGNFSYLEINRNSGETDADAKKRAAKYIDDCSLELYAGI